MGQPQPASRWEADHQILKRRRLLKEGLVALALASAAAFLAIVIANSDAQFARNNPTPHSVVLRGSLPASSWR